MAQLQQEQAAKTRLISSLPELLQTSDNDAITAAVLALTGVDEPTCAGLMQLPVPNRRAAVMGYVQQRAAGAASSSAAPVTRDDLIQLLQPLQRFVITTYANQHLPAQSVTSSISQHLRHKALAAYDAISDDGQKTWCVITGMWWPQLAVKAAERQRVVPYVRNAHIVPRKCPADDWASMQLGPSPDVLANVVPMMAGVEWAFDRNAMCVVPRLDAETGMVRFDIHVLDPDLMDKRVYHQFKNSNQKEGREWTDPLPQPQLRDDLGEVVAAELTFGQLHGKALVFRGEQRPAKRCFTYHAYWALYWAKKCGWGAGGLVIDRDHFGWQSPAVAARLQDTALWVAMQLDEVPGGEDVGVAGSDILDSGSLCAEGVADE